MARPSRDSTPCNHELATEIMPLLRMEAELAARASYQGGRYRRARVAARTEWTKYDILKNNDALKKSRWAASGSGATGVRSRPAAP